MDPSALQQEIGKREPFALSEEEVFLNLARTTDLLSGQLNDLFKRAGLSAPLYNVLRILRGEGRPLACLEITRNMVTREPDMTRLLDRLEKKGLISRTRGEQDRRVVLTEITPEGRNLVDSLDQPVTTLHRSLLGHLPPEEQAELIRLLVRARRPHTSTGDANP